MANPLTKCMECKKIMTSREAKIHWKRTGHNRWELIAPKQGGE